MGGRSHSCFVLLACLLGVLGCCVRCRLRRAVEIWLSDAGIGGNAKSSSLRGFDTGPLLEFADRENLLGTDAEEAAAEQQHFISRNS